MNIELLRKRGWIIFECISGSHAYGLNIEGSDVDIRGVYIQPTEMVLRDEYIEQVSDSTNDTTFYEIGRFIELLEKGNPNMLELLNVGDEHIIYKSGLFDRYFPAEEREKFISQKLKHTFTGYAYSQIKKAKGLNKKINWDKTKVERKDVLDFCYVIDDKEKSKPFKHWTRVPDSNYGLAKVNNAPDLYSLYHLGSGGGIIGEDSNDVQLRSIPKNAPHLGYLKFDKNAYSTHCKDYREYTEWLENRNPERYKTNMKHGKGYDCYLDSETEYLTDKGWKKFDDVSDDDLLGTIIDGENNNIKFQQPLNRFSENYTGDIYTYEDRYTRFSVTPNHKLLLSKFFRNNNDNNSRIYNPQKADWGFCTVEEYLNTRGECHYVSHLGIGQSEKATISTDECMLIGAYLGDGHVSKKRGRVVEIRISQNENKPLARFLEKTCDAKYFSRDSKMGKNYVYCFRNKDFVKLILDNFGVGSKGKFLSRWCETLDNKQFESLLKGMLLSDGTIKESGSTYYSVNKKLVDDLQYQLFLRGYYCSIYEYTQTGSFLDTPYTLFQLFIPKDSKKTFRIMQKKNFKLHKVVQDRITCFEMPTGVLITRNGGKIAVQGNSKNMMHCMRLLGMAEDIAAGRGIVVKRPNRDYLLSIRNGEVKYEDLLEKAEQLIEKIKDAFDSTDIPKSVSKSFIRDLLYKIRVEEWER